MRATNYETNKTVFNITINVATNKFTNITS